MKSLAKILSLASALFLLVTVLPASVSAQSTFKVGFVNTEEIISKLPEFKEIDAKLQTLQQSYQDTLRMIQTEYQTLVDGYQKQQAMMSPEARTTEEQKIGAVREKFLRFQQERLGQGGAIFQYQAQLTQPVREKIRAAIEKVAKAEKLSLVMETGVTLYFDEKMDITFKVLDYLKRGTN